MVRLKVIQFEYAYRYLSIFQFLMVRLKEGTLRKGRLRNINISIPYGAIKRIFFLAQY